MIDVDTGEITSDNYEEVVPQHIRELIEEALLYRALECGGVDNWEWYEDSIENYDSFIEEGLHVKEATKLMSEV